jgi:RNase adaptor protein for sRNA GlmZ degradation
VTVLVHATAVAIGGRAVLLLGRSGSGKSDLALRLIDRGAVLIADDQVVLTAGAGVLVADAPATIAGLIEARGVGLLPQSHRRGVVVALAIDLEGVPQRLPEVTRRVWAGVSIPLVALAPFEVSAPIKVEQALTTHGLIVERHAVPKFDAPNDIPIDARPAPVAATTEAASNNRILLVTGMSGAGKSTALKALEDMGYEAVDNLPLGLLDRLLEPLDEGDAALADRPLAFGIDSRTRGFDGESIVERLRSLRADGHDVQMLFLDCTGGELTRRFSETRRRHPLALDRPAVDGIAREREMLAPLRRWADVVIDTTDYQTPDLRRALADRFGRPGVEALTLTIMSFGFARGLPRDADLVFDMRFLANPHWDPMLRPLTGEDAAVGAFVAADPAFTPAFERIADLLLTLLPGYGREGKAYLTVAFGCTGGRHRSVYVARQMAARLATAGYAATVVHRDRSGDGDNDAPVPHVTGRNLGEAMPLADSVPSGDNGSR